MIFVGWVEYPSMKFCVHRTDSGSYFCSKYTVGGNKVMGAVSEFQTKEELKDFLIKIPSPPIEFINEFVLNLE